MELFLPSLFVVLIGVLAVLYLLPKQSGILLGVLALVLLIFAVYQHISMFRTDYTRLTIIDTMKANAPFVLSAAVVIILIGYLILLFTGNKNPVTNVMNRATEVVKSPFRGLTPTPNKPNNFRPFSPPQNREDLERELERI
jgi:hypothetical protein